MATEKSETSEPSEPHQETAEFARQRSLTDAESHDNFVKSFQGKRRLITVEPLVAMYIVIMYLQISVMGQYIYFRVGRDHNITANSKLAFVCDPKANNSGEEEKTNRIQGIYTYYMMFIQLSSSICTILLAPFYCVFSDRYGRRAMFMIPAMGVFIKTIFEILIQIYQWPLSAFIITEGFYGLCGGFNFAIGLTYSYVADISTQKARTKRMAIVGVIMAVGALCVSLGSGYWIRANGYLIPYIFSGCVSVICIIYTFFVLPEPPKMHESKAIKLSHKEQMKKLFTIYIRSSKTETALLILVLFIFNLYYISEMSGISLSGTYLMGYPLCFTTELLGIYGFANMLSINVGMAITVVILTRCFSDLGLLLLCLASGIAYTTQMAFAKNVPAVFIAVATNLFSFTAFPFIRGYMSKKMGHQEQGALFGGLVLSETVSGAITKVIIIYVYKETFLIFRGIVYLIITGFSLIAFVLTLIALPLHMKLKNMEGYVSVN